MALLTADMKRDQFHVARDHWIEAESKICAYRREFNRTRRLSNALKWLTIVSAIMTALSATETAVARGATWKPWATAASGLLTAVLATIERLYKPDDRMQALWDCAKKLEDVKRNVVAIATGIKSAEAIGEGSDLF